MEKLFTQIKGQILDKPTERMEMAGYSDKDIMAIRAVAIYEGVNANNALFEKDDLEKAVNTLVGKPLRILFDGENPTGHGFDRETRKFSTLVTNIGFIQWAYGQENEVTGKYEIVVEVAVWQKYYPEICQRLRELHRDGELKFSIEADREFEITPEGYRRCFNILFTGLAVVRNPAFDEARSMMVAEILEKGGQVQMEELMKLVSGLNESIGTEIAEQFKSNLGTLNAEIDTLKSKVEVAENETAEVKAELAEANGKLKEVEADRDKYKNVVETAEKEALGAERLDKLSKYGKPEKSAEELAELSKDEYAEELIKAVENYNPSEVAEVDATIGNFEKTGKNKESNRDKLLAFCEGLS
jgi:outer membrane murein-binding lipoprotein Lpp